MRQKTKGISMLGVIHLQTHNLLYAVSSKLKEDFTADSNESEEDD